MDIIDIIAKKRDRKELTQQEIEYFVKGVTDGTIADYQASALLMAVFLNGMTDRETTDLTLAMADSGERVDLSTVNGLTVDKHSTGGVGDKTTVIVVPIAAALGAHAAKMSGRALGHTGGTVDKLESIPGFRTAVDPDEFIDIINKTGAAMIGQSKNIAAADKKLYALRDVTATVESVPLITSSIMSKKIASGSDCIILDVKCGSGAFMKNTDDAQKLAESMIRIGKLCGKRITALITDMDIPLGFMVGNTLEIIEAVSVLKNEQKGDLYELCIELAANMYSLTSSKTVEECRILAKQAVESGKAFEKLKEIVSAQGGDASYLIDTSKFKKAEFCFDVISECEGFISDMNCEAIGLAANALGAGREKKEDSIDHSAGIELCRKTGDHVNKGEILAKLYTNTPEKLDGAKAQFLSAVEFSEEKPQPKPLIYKIIQ
ncbi:MAG: thymidine phosphorylase [Acutalibacteraceae bacterium]|nr:thymidine phosphorylase [Clostridia bacterium]MEE3449214.1 thymidine phosphorylase [Acutalibacteraceae bacterium]